MNYKKLIRKRKNEFLFQKNTIPFLNLKYDLLH